MDEQTYTQTIDAIYDGALAMKAWPAALVRLGNVFRCNGAGLVVRSLAAPVGNGIATGPDADSYREYLEHWMGRNVISNRTRVWRAYAVETDQDILPKSEFMRSDYYNGYFRPRDFHAVLRLSLCCEAGVWTGISLVRPRSAGEFETQDVELAGKFLPHLRRSVTIARQLQHAQLGSGAALNELDQTVVLLDADGRPLFLNRAAERLLEQADGLTLAPTGLQCATPALTSRLRTLLGRAGRRQAGGAPAAAAMRLPRPSGRAALSLLVVPLRPEIAWFLPRPPAAMVFVTDPDASPALPAERLMELFGLTRAEARIALELLAGHDVGQIAERLGRSVHTVRVHLARLLAKTETSRQGELVRLLMTLPRAHGT